MRGHSAHPRAGPDAPAARNGLPAEVRSGPAAELPLLALELPHPGAAQPLPIPAGGRPPFLVGLNARGVLAAAPVWIGHPRCTHSFPAPTDGEGPARLRAMLWPPAQRRPRGIQGWVRGSKPQDGADSPGPWDAQDGAQRRTPLQELHLSDQGGSSTSLIGSGGKATSALLRANPGHRILASKIQV